jgi:DNA-directed RNA polymerase specialized sigma24 family protein
MHPDPTDEELKRWLNFAKKEAKKKQFPGDHLSLGPEHYASEAIEELLKRDERPDNVEAWLKKVIFHAYLNHKKRMVLDDIELGGDAIKRRRVDYRDGFEPKEQKELEYKLLRGASSLGTSMVREERLAIVLEALSPKDREMIDLKLDSFDTAEIAELLGYASAKVVANRLKIIRGKMEEEFGEQGRNLF